MKAAVIREYGGPEVIAVEDVPEPQAAAGEAVVRLHAAALNHADMWIRRGMRGTARRVPHILGTDGAGVVCALGAGVRCVEMGQEVVIKPGFSCGCCEFCRAGQQILCVKVGILGMSRPGTFAEQVAVPSACLALKPAHLSFEEAAALPVAHTTAWRMLITRAGLRPGESVLIHGIGGGVALAGLQIARLAGARVIVTSSSDEKLEKARALGADETVNYRTISDVGARVRELTGGRGVDVAFDSVGAATWPVDFAAVRRGGRIVQCGVTTGAEAVTNLQALHWNHLTVLGSSGGSYEDFQSMLRAVTVAGLKPVVDCVLPLDEVRTATERLERGEQFGKIVLTIYPP